MVLFPGFPCCASRAVYQPATLPPRRSRWGLPRASASLFLHAAACGLRQTFTSSPTRMLSGHLRGACKPSASATRLFRSGPSPSGCAVTPTASRMLCRRVAHLVRRVTTTPPWTQDSLRVGGSLFPDRDFHPARDAKQAWRDHGRHNPLPTSAARSKSGSCHCWAATRLMPRH